MVVMVNVSGCSDFSYTNLSGRQVELSLDLNPPCCTVPKGVFQASSGGAVRSFSLYTANIDSERARSLLERAALLDAPSFDRFLDRIHSSCSHVFDLEELVMEEGLASQDPKIQKTFQKWDDAAKARIRFSELQRAVSDLIRYQEDQRSLAVRSFDWEKDRIYFAYAEAPCSAIFPGSPLLEALRQTQGAGMWTSPYNALACPRHPRHELTRQVLQDIVKGNPHAEGAPNWKLYDDLSYLYHHGDLPDALLDSLHLEGRVPQKLPKINFSLLVKEMPIFFQGLAAAPSA